MAIGTVPRVFLIPIAPKYTETTYKRVSDEPAITEAHLPTKLSAPYVSNILDIIAVDAPPDSGLTKIKGIISDGIPIFAAMGPKNEDNATEAPLALNIYIALSNATRVGNSLIDVLIPSFAPSRNTENKSLREKNIANPIRHIIIGTVN